MTRGTPPDGTLQGEEAIVRLLAAKSENRLGAQAEEAELLLGGMYLSYGHHLEAAAIYERLLADDANPAIRDRTWSP